MNAAIPGVSREGLQNGLKRFHGKKRFRKCDKIERLRDYLIAIACKCIELWWLGCDEVTLKTSSCVDGSY